MKTTRHTDEHGTHEPPPLQAPGPGSEPPENPNAAHLRPDGPAPVGDGETALAYARRMFERQQVPLPPYGFEVDWTDQPAKHKHYRDALRVPLPSPFRQMPSVTLDHAVGTAARTSDDAPATVDALSSALACYGLDGRRTEPNWNDDSSSKLRTGYAVWSRPTASGGGMYPAESYLVVGDAGPLPAGVYHYATAHHGLDRLAVGSRCAALSRSTGVAADLYLVATLRFWKNAFKYNSFSYHVVSQDVGALLASWRLVFGSYGITVEPVLWFDEAPVCEAIEIDGRAEAPFLVVPLLRRTPADGGPVGTGTLVDGELPRLGTAARSVEHRVWERSRRVRTFPLVDEVHAAALVGNRPRPSSEAARSGEPVPPPADTGTAVDLPDAETAAADLDLTASLRARRSSFGVLTAHPPLSLGDLGWVLSVTEGLGGAGTDVAPAPRPRPWTRLWVLANHVDGLDARGYAYDGERHQLWAGRPVDFGELQRRYALTNYNIREVAAIVVITGRLEPLVRAYGGRGYRMLSIEVGQSAQALYLACAARELSAGAVLGVDNPTVDTMLGIDETDESSMLFVLIGHERVPRAGYDHTFPRPGRSRHS